ncbi:hypothetical protein [Nocardiopsis lambiniae]|uniref:Uncharacterized protein n=1 Tax=Nocardiopsis lambiniae TaxID=3075539 RepID=A0ABU2M336_9ACTN|nr:hypothetical protein [Nocardiopsis sp. DSM 44743]MDT0327061.1 hypothetical protein [Nocardiopsis sp. DSM 44743]
MTTQTHVRQVTITQPDAADVALTWASDVPGMSPGAVLMDLDPGVTLHLQTELDDLDAPYVEALITALIVVRERMPEAVSAS